jgi:hypothetical protein
MTAVLWVTGADSGGGGGGDDHDVAVRGAFGDRTSAETGRQHTHTHTHTAAAAAAGAAAAAATRYHGRSWWVVLATLLAVQTVSTLRPGVTYKLRLQQIVVSND